MDDKKKDEDDKLKDILKKNYFSFDINSMSNMDQSLKDMLFGPDMDETLFKQLNNFADSVFANWGENPLPSTDAIIFIGKNSYNEAVFKPKHFVVDELYVEYLNHIRSHAAHTLQQPEYYKNFHEILN